MKKVFLKRIFPATLLLTVALTFNFIGYSNKVQAKDINNEKVFIQNLDGSISNDKFADIHSVPENFDATKATDEELKYYHIPARPKDSKKLAIWKKIVSCKWIKPELVEINNKHSVYKKINSTPNIENFATTASAVKAEESDTTYYYNNPVWAGYVYNNPCVKVVGDWLVPKVSAPSSAQPAASSQWVGLGGYITKTLVQAGTRGDVSSTGATSYYAWYEIIGTNYKSPYEIKINNLPCKPGDEMYCDVSISISGNNMTANFFISNNTQHISTSFSATVSQFNNVPNSAEWVVEAPQRNGVKLNYALTTDAILNEATTRFATCSYSTSGIDSGSGSFIKNSTDLINLSLVNGSNVQAKPTEVGTGSWESFIDILFDNNTQSSFNVNWENYN